MNSEKDEKFLLLVDSLKGDFKNENLHNVIIDYSIENDREMELINLYKEYMNQYPEVCKEMLERLSDRSVQRLYVNKIKKKSDEEGRRTAIKLVLILIATIIAMFFIWKGILTSFKGQFLN